jgi:SAM-dependent methyltransferase
MRDHNKAFCRLVAETLDCLQPIYEFGAYQVDGQEGYADLRAFFPDRAYVGCDMRPGPGVDRVEDVTSISLPEASAGTVLCVETFEHVFDVKAAFSEVFRILKPGGVFVITTPFNFRIHGYPDDYWRLTPNCVRRMLANYAICAVGYQGHRAFPHTVMGVAVKAPAPQNCHRRLETLIESYQAWLRRTAAGLPLGAKLRRGLTRLYRSKGERRQVINYYSAAFEIDTPGPAPLQGARRPSVLSATAR